MSPAVLIAAPFLIVGAIAQLVDGSLGMGFGVVSSTLLLFFGLSPVIVSTATHLAEAPTSFVSAVSHIRQKNVDYKLLGRLAIPGAISAFIGAVILSNLDLSGGKKWMSILLISMGILLIIRFSAGTKNWLRLPEKYANRSTPIVGVIAGLTDATGGGGWGPVTVPTLLTTTEHSPRKVIGTANTAEFLVTICALLGFLLYANTSGIPWAAVGGLAAGGMIAAPIAARLTARIPQESLGLLVGGTIVAVNLRSVVPPEAILPLIVATVVVIGSIFGYKTLRNRDRELVTVSE